MTTKKTIKFYLYFNNSFETEIFNKYIKDVLAQVHPNIEMTVAGKKLINSLLVKICKKLASEASQIAQSEGKNEIDQKHIEMAVQSVLNGDLIKCSLKEGEKTVDKFKVSCQGEKKAHVGLIFDVDVVHRFLHESKYADSINDNAIVFLTAVIEYLCGEITELSGYRTLDRKSKKVNTIDINIAINDDSELFLLRSQIDK